MLLKVISKVLVSRIRPFLEEFIGPLQSSFIPKRWTTGNALIAHEIVHQMHKKKGKRGFLLFKIDFEKAYDRVDWGFFGAHSNQVWISASDYWPYNELHHFLLLEPQMEWRKIG